MNMGILCNQDISTYTGKLAEYMSAFFAGF